MTFSFRIIHYSHCPAGLYRISDEGFGWDENSNNDFANDEVPMDDIQTDEVLTDNVPTDADDAVCRGMFFPTVLTAGPINLGMSIAFTS